MTKKSICFIVSSPFTAKVFLLNHIKVLSKEFNVYLVANFDDFEKSMFSSSHLTSIKHIAIPREINIMKDINALLNLRTYLKKNNFDAVHTVTPKAGLIGITASKLAMMKMRTHIFTGQVWHTKKGIFKSFLKFLDKIIVWNATNILVDGESQRQFLINNNIIKNSNSLVLGKGSISGVDINKFIPNKSIRKEIRKELNIKTNETVFMFLGRMNIDKGIPELADAFNKLKNNYKNVKLLLVGGDEGNLTQLVKEKINDSSSVIFYGITPKPEHLIQACDIFCLPSHREGFGTSIIEASLLEKPIICSDTYGLMETIIENKTGLRHQVNDVNSLYTQMEKLVNNKDTIIKLGKEGRRYILQHFTANIISEKWLEYYKNNLINS